MISSEHNTFYDILEVKHDASPQEIREAYLRTKNAFSKDSVALYSLISQNERDEMLHRIEEAYMILSNTQKRKEYDRYHGIVKPEDETLDFIKIPPKNIISIDRVPPMETSRSAEELLIPPTTDFGSSAGTSSQVPSADMDQLMAGTAEVPAPVSAPAHVVAPVQQPAPQVHQPQQPQSHIPSQAQLDALKTEIAQESEWRGTFLRKVRETHRITLEELSAVSKISKGYLNSIETEDFQKLPAPVFVRGFVIQIAKTFHLPHEKVAKAYMDRYSLNAKK
jgi:hypothetical protein